ncbi:hypothetical protein FOA52_008655 [Chlamydomonas sp. UWO 241]|nr:hypothetical protein FOA52_008655 [Chlamydomonas sp. UWO 241]
MLSGSRASASASLSARSRPTACCAPKRAPVSGRALSVSVRSASAHAASTAIRVTIQGRRLPVTDAIKQYVELKIGKAVGHFTMGIKAVDVTLSARGGDTGTHGPREQKVELTIHTLHSGVVRVEDAEENLYAAIDLVCDKAERKLTRTKERAVAKGRWHSHGGAHVEDDEAKEAERELRYETQQVEEQQALEAQLAVINTAFPPSVRRSKVVELDLMTVDEAIDAMHAVGHDFFVYREAATDTMQVVYRRGAGGVGVLHPRNRE